MEVARFDAAQSLKNCETDHLRLVTWQHLSGIYYIDCPAYYRCNYGRIYRNPCDYPRPLLILKSRAEERLTKRGTPGIDEAKCEIALRRAMIRLTVAEKVRRRRKV